MISPLLHRDCCCLPPLRVSSPLKKQEITHHFKNDALYRFDGDRFKGLECKEKVRDLILSPNCVDGCKVSVKYSNSRPSMFRKHTWYFACSHARVHSQTQESFASGLVSKTNVSKQTLKRTKTQRTAVKGRGFDVDLLLFM